MAATYIDVSPVFTGLVAAVNGVISTNSGTLSLIAGSLLGLSVLFSVYHRVKSA